jgi:hypothetical protein
MQIANQWRANRKSGRPSVRVVFAHANYTLTRGALETKLCAKNTPRSAGALESREPWPRARLSPLQHLVSAASKSPPRVICMRRLNKSRPERAEICFHAPVYIHIDLYGYFFAALSTTTTHDCFRFINNKVGCSSRTIPSFHTLLCSRRE